MDSRRFVDLTPANSVVEDIETPPSRRALGGSEPDIEVRNIRMYIGEKPRAADLRMLYQKTGRDIPPEVDLFQAYNAYVLSHTVGIVKEHGWDQVRQIGYRMKFPPGADILVLDVMPQSKFVEAISGGFNFNGALQLNGEVGIPQSVSKVIGKSEVIGIGGKLDLAADAGVVGKFSFRVVSNEIQSIGKGNTYAEWVFNKTNNPLWGDDIEMFQVVLVDRFTQTLEFEAKIYSTISSWVHLKIPTRRESEWVRLKCNLKE